MPAHGFLGDFQCINPLYTRFSEWILVQSSCFLFVVRAMEHLRQRNDDVTQSKSHFFMPNPSDTIYCPKSITCFFSGSLNESCSFLVRGCWLSPWGTGHLHLPLPRRQRPARGEGARGGQGKAACAPGRRPASGCRRSRGWCNARPAWSPAPAGPAMPDSPEKCQREEGLRLPLQALCITTNGLLSCLERIIRQSTFAQMPVRTWTTLYCSTFFIQIRDSMRWRTLLKLQTSANHFQSVSNLFSNAYVSMWHLPVSVYGLHYSYIVKYCTVLPYLEKAMRENRVPGTSACLCVSGFDAPPVSKHDWDSCRRCSASAFWLAAGCWSSQWLRETERERQRVSRTKSCWC